MDTVSAAPASSKEFDKIYGSAFAHWMWSDTRIPSELKELVAKLQPQTSLELGCGLGRFSAFMAQQGIKATGVDFSPVAIKNANKRYIEEKHKPVLLTGDVTNLSMFTKPFDVAFDVGCFHCLNETGQQRYAAEAARLLNPGLPLLIWAIDSSPSGIKLSPDYMAKVFQSGFELQQSKFSRRRIIASHWYWLVRIEKPQENL
ncbi:MAG: class I SAM-dependent methyltransferase [Sphingobacteriaceae bacterium]|nr:MAG: class I SAM-dependent methyltransferase [Sphingobacteriaceae bacterium]